MSKYNEHGDKELVPPQLAKYRWEKGQSGNPNGRPVGRKNKLKSPEEVSGIAQDLIGLDPVETLAHITNIAIANGDYQLAMRGATELAKYTAVPTSKVITEVDSADELSREQLESRLDELRGGLKAIK